jgi:putative methionine-R-sulfoxide reductase with GAF domain
LVLLGAIAWWTGSGARRFWQTIGKEDKLIKLQEEIIDVKEKNQHNEDIASQVCTVIANAKNFLVSLNGLRKLENPDEVLQPADYLIQRVVEALSSDVKSSPGEQHRCGLWLDEENGELIMYKGSSGFPENYINQRKLDIDHSIAGKAYRKQQTVKKDDVQNDEDWEPNPDSNSKYSAIICIPISKWGVLTIDAKKPMNNEQMLIGELYSYVIEGAINEFMQSFEAVSQVSVTLDNKK